MTSMVSTPATTFGPFEGQFVRSVDGALTGPGALAVVVLIALVAGAAHGLAPGHGKTLAAAYLVGNRRRYRDAFLLGAAVAGAHSLSALLFGGVLLVITRNPGRSLPEPLMQLLPALAVMVVGIVLVRRHLLFRDRLDHRDHHHDLPDRASRTATLSVALFAGLVPSPSVMLLLATAVVVGRLVLGLVLVVVFSVGLAITVAVAGILGLRARDLLERASGSRPRLARVAALAPVVASFLVLLVGLGASVLAVVRLVG